MKRIVSICGLVAAIGIALISAPTAVSAAPTAPRTVVAKTPIQHFLFLMQSDRSFDSYFGTYPGADGIPAGVCQARVARSAKAGCVKPFALTSNAIPPLGASNPILAKQVDKGKLDGFVSALQSAGRDGATAMGHYDQQQLPAYWRAAQQYVLFDQFFSSTQEGPRVNRSYWVSGQPDTVSAAAAKAGVGPMTIFDELQAAGVSWKFYVQNYVPQDNFRGRSQTATNTQTARVPLLDYARFVDNPALSSHIVDMSQYYVDLQAGTLPQVAYLATSGASEQSGRSMAAGQKLVTSLTGQLMLSKYWSSSAFMWSYDSSGGWYDHVVPPKVDSKGYGLRVPALLISPYARRGQVNHTVLDYTSALAFIEKNWGLRPMSARDATSHTFMTAFNFNAKPRAPQLLSAANTNTTPPLPSVKIIYLSYGSAIVLVIGFLGFASFRSARRDRHRRVPAVPSEPLVKEMESL